MCDNPYLFQFLDICHNNLSIVVSSFIHILTLSLHRIIHSLKQRCNEEVFLIFCLITVSSRLQFSEIFFSIFLRDISFINFKTRSNLFEINQCTILIHVYNTIFCFHDNIKLPFRSITEWYHSN